MDCLIAILSSSNGVSHFRGVKLDLRMSSSKEATNNLDKKHVICFQKLKYDNTSEDTASTRIKFYIVSFILILIGKVYLSNKGIRLEQSCQKTAPTVCFDIADFGEFRRVTFFLKTTTFKALVDVQLL